MKVKLLKKLRRRGRSKIHVSRTIHTNGVLTGLDYRHYAGYGGLYSYGDSVEDMYLKAERVYIGFYLKSKGR